MQSFHNALIMGICIANAISVPTIATAGVFIDVDVAPPAARIEVVPPARVGYVWAPDRWEQRGSHWHHEMGHWER